jgi:hypothetical protein
MIGRWSALAGAVAMLAGCGSDDPKQNVVDVQGDEYAFVLPSSFGGSWTTIRLENTGKEPHEFALAKLDGERTRADVLEVLSDPATQEKGPPGWVSIRAGIPTLQAGETASLTQVLEPGRYALICFLEGPSGKPHFLDGMLGVVDVGEEAGGEDRRQMRRWRSARLCRRLSWSPGSRRSSYGTTRTSRTPSSSSRTSRARRTRTPLPGRRAG